MTLILKLTFISTLTLVSSRSFALVNAELFYGMTTSTAKFTKTDGTTESKNLKGTDLGACLILDPIPLVPVGFGFMAIQGTTKYDDVSNAQAQEILSASTFSGGSASGTGTSKTLFYGPVLKVWAPIPKVKPYIRAAYLMGAETTDETIKVSNAASDLNVTVNPKTVYTHTATNIGIGIGFAPMPLTSIFAEYSIHNGKRKAKALSGTMTTEMSGNSVDTPLADTDLTDDDKKQIDANAKSIRLGVSVGI